MKKILLLFIILRANFVFAQKTQLDSLMSSLIEMTKEPQKHTFIKMIVIGNKGCNLQSSTSIEHSGQFTEYLITIPKGRELERIECKKYVIDSLNANYNVIKFYSNSLSFGISNNCKVDSTSFNISQDSIYTISNLNYQSKSYEELENVKGFGGDSGLFSDVIIGVWLHPNFEFVSIRDNVESANFKYLKKNDIELSASNINEVGFEIKYRRKKTKLKIKTKSIKVKGLVKLKIYDTQLEDGDIVNVFINDNLILENYTATNTPVIIPFNKQVIKSIKIENVSVGRIPPNTVFLDVIDDNSTQIINVKTSDKESFQIDIITK